jgi:hypothetical protein
MIRSDRIILMSNVQRVGWRQAYTILVVKPEGKRTPGRQRRRWEDNIKMYYKELQLRECGLDSGGSGQGPVTDFCEHGNEHWCSQWTELNYYPVFPQTPSSSFRVCASLSMSVTRADFYQDPPSQIVKHLSTSAVHCSHSSTALHYVIKAEVCIYLAAHARYLCCRTREHDRHILLSILHETAFISTYHYILRKYHLKLVYESMKYTELLVYFRKH